MKIIINITLLAIVIISLISGCIEENHELHWNNYNEDIFKYESDNTVILLYFQSSGCYGCRAMEKKVFTNKSVIDVLKQFTCIKINALIEKNLSKRYNVSSYPVIIILKSNQELKRINGSITDTRLFLKELDLSYLLSKRSFAV